MGQWKEVFNTMNEQQALFPYLEDFRLVVVAVEHTVQALVGEVERCRTKTSIDLSHTHITVD